MSTTLACFRASATTFFPYGGKLRHAAEKQGNLLGQDEDAYAARIARNLWRVANRRAAEMRPVHAEPQRVTAGAQTPMSDSRGPSRAVRRDQSHRAAAQDPRTLAEFLQALAAELGSDEPDPDAS